MKTAKRVKLSLYPLKSDKVIAAVLQVKPEPKVQKSTKAKRRVKRSAK